MKPNPRYIMIVYTCLFFLLFWHDNAKAQIKVFYPENTTLEVEGNPKQNQNAPAFSRGRVRCESDEEGTIIFADFDAFGMSQTEANGRCMLVSDAIVAVCKKFEGASPAITPCNKPSRP